MKRNKVLLGLYVGLLTLAGGVANAQTDRFYEIGPDNVGGQISSIVVAREDTSRNTLYAGATTGGLFLKSGSSTILHNLYQNLGTDEARANTLSKLYDTWHHVPFIQNGKEVSLPISCMVQTPSNELIIGTGSDNYAYGTTYSKMSRKGMGIYRYNPATNEFKLIPTTAVSTTDTNFKTINAIEYYHGNGTLYLYAATNAGLYRWVVIDGSDSWTATPTRVFAGRVDNLVISRTHQTAFFSSGNQLYRIGDVTAGSSSLNPINISSSNPAFGGSNIAIKLAVSQTDTTFLYAMVIKNTGLMDAIYMTNNEQTWTRLTTSTVMPMTYTSGANCGALAIDPTNPRRIIVGGTNVLLGEGFVDGSYFQWTTASASEFELNYGDYMSTVYGSLSFVHSGIQQIVPVYHTDAYTGYHTVYFATDGGIYSSKFYGRNGFDTVFNENRGLNNIQINGLAVAPDGTLIMGASNNACPIIETHLAHHGGNPVISWYDNGSLGNVNHTANVLWTGNGGAVAASAFQQIYPQSRRTIFVTSENAQIGRSYADYLDYTNTNTWTTGLNFRSKFIFGESGPTIGSISLWETTENTHFNSYLRMAVDTLGYIFRKNGNNWDTIWVNDTAYGANRGGNFQIRRGDKALFHSRGHADYPFEYVFDNAQRAKDSVTVLNPIQSRLLFIADLPPAGTSDVESNSRGVWFSWNPTDFTKVFNQNDFDGQIHEGHHYFSDIYFIQRTPGTSSANHYPRQAVFSRDARFVYISTYDVATHKSMLVRVRGFENVDFSSSDYAIYDTLIFKRPNPVLAVDTLRFNGDIWFPRPISNIAVDQREGQDRLILTFEDFSDAMANVAVVNNASTGSYTITPMPLADASMPVYTAIVEDSTGTIFVGCETGVYTRTTTGSWQSYNKLTGVPVTAIVQQTNKLPIRHNLTHTGIAPNHFVFAKTKWPRAIYFGTYGRGVFMDMQYVTDTVNEVVDSNDFNPVNIPTVHTIGLNSVKLFPNPVYDEANMVLNAAIAGKGELRVYDLNGRLVMTRNLGHIAEGEHTYSIDCTGMAKGMYLINVTISGHTATAKMIVR